MSQPTESSQPPVRKPYSTPRLVEYGPVEKLTHSGTGVVGDGGPMMRLTCL
jgi:hypothetical protein